ncbi:hypothetical protein F5Y11DRAFT_146952 [Daldinia sp. FL1419]|nr:hypothetical protein F5Y11DRAFT_146952 [Daldinia sp. FL1419]
MGDDSNYYSSCDSPAPSNFYCHIDTNCIVLAANTTVLCCPKASRGNCQEINVIACNLDQQIPFSSIQTIVREGDLPRCGTGCCPWGYHCGSDNLCYMDQDQSNPPPSLQSTTNLIVDHPPTSTLSSSAVTLSSSLSTTFDISVNPLTASSYTSLVTPASSLGNPSSTIVADPAPEGTQAANSSGTALRASEIAGISIGGFFGIVLMILVAFFIYRIRGPAKESKNDERYQTFTVLNVKDKEKLPEPRRELHGAPVFELSN